MRCRPRSCILPAILPTLVAVSLSAYAQTPASPISSPPPPPVEAVPRPAAKPIPKTAAKPIPKTAAKPIRPAPRPKPLKRPAPTHKPVAKVPQTPARPGAPTGNWIRLNTHLLGTVGESTWVNLAQAVNIRFYQTGKTTFASVGVGGSSYVSTSDPAEIAKLRAYVLTHQAR